MTALATQTPAETRSPAPTPPGPGVQPRSPLTAAQRVAVVLSLMEPDRAREVAAGLDPGAADRVIAAYEAMGSPPRPVVLQVIASFVAELRSPHPSVRGGHKQAQALAAAIAREEAESDEAAEDPSSLAEGAAPEAVWAHLRKMEPEALARTLGGERPSVIAAVLSRLPEAGGGTLLAALEEADAVAVVRYIAGARPVTNEALDAIAESLRIRTAGKADAPEAPDGTAALTALLNRCPLSRQEAVLTPLRADAEETAARVEAGLLRYATLAERLPRSAAPILFREADQKVLDLALRFGAETAPEATDYLYANISQRLAEQIRERVAALPAPSQEDGEAAQAEVIGQLLRWIENGRFALEAAAED